MGKFCTGLCQLTWNTVQEIGAINLPLAYNGKKKFASWIGYLFTLLAVATALDYTFEQLGNVGTVLALFPPEPTGKFLTPKDVKKEYY